MILPFWFNNCRFILFFSIRCCITSNESILFNFLSARINKVIIIVWILIKHLNILWIHYFYCRTFRNNLLSSIWYQLFRLCLLYFFVSILFFNLSFTIQECSFVSIYILTNNHTTVSENWWFLSLKYFLSGGRFIILFYRNDIHFNLSCLFIHIMRTGRNRLNNLLNIW